MTDAQLILAALSVPLVGCGAIVAFGRAPNLREAATLITAFVLLAVTLTLAHRTGVAGAAGAAGPALQLIAVTPELALAFRLEPLGAVFAVLASGLWIVNSLYSIGYMRGGGEKDQTRFYALFAVAIASAMGVAMAADLFTLFVFYEALTFSTYGLVAHKGDAKARRGARVYMTVLLLASLGLLLPAIVATYAYAGTLVFTPGGVFADAAAATADGGPAPAALTAYGVILVLFAFGIGKAALMPMHPWLPNAMVAPTPVSALLHAVAVVKAGVFTMLKVSTYVFGPELMQVLPAADGLTIVAALSIVLASVIAMTKTNFKARLAYSTVSQLAYVTLGAMLATPAALMGGALQLVFHAFGKITLFMCAGAIYVGAKRTEIPDLVGLARAMPWTFGAFAVGAASIIGLPPLAGAWPKLFLMSGAVEAGTLWVLGSLVISSILNVAYLAPIPARAALLVREAATPAGAFKGAPALAVLPPVLTAFACVILFFCVGPLITYLEPAFSGRPWVSGVGP